MAREISRRPPIIVRRFAGAAGRGIADGAAPPRQMIAAPVLWSATIRGEPVPRGPRHEVLLADGIARLVRSRAARRWQNLAMAQLLNGRPARPLACDLVLECRLWSAAERGALDDGLVLELLERAAIIATGGLVREKHLFAAVDKAAPRLVVTLAPLGGGG